jgi:hypothetical protein
MKSNEEKGEKTSKKVISEVLLIFAEIFFFPSLGESVTGCHQQRTEEENGMEVGGANDKHEEQS